jgi:peptidyl-prolyl cis-trans isomerase A (cyclophilin A)
MKLAHTLLLPALAVAFAASAAAQSASKPAEELPDSPTATAAVLTRPNGPTVVMDTSMGRITCQFFQRQAPKTVANFIALAEGTKDWTDPATNKKQHNKPLYDGTVFHRVIPDFMIQGGDPVGNGMGDPGYKFADEFDPNLGFDVPGRLAMANSGPNTNGSQFFITTVPTEFLNHVHTIFGQCDASGLLVAQAITKVPRDSNDKPLTPVVLKKVTIVPEGQPVPARSTGASIPPESRPKRITISAGVAATLIQPSQQPDYHVNNLNKAHLSDPVSLEAVIGSDGTIKELKVMSGPERFQQPAVDAAKTWRYQPYLLNGEPVEVQTTINVIFDLDTYRASSPALR